MITCTPEQSMKVSPRRSSTTKWACRSARRTPAARTDVGRDVQLAYDVHPRPVQAVTGQSALEHRRRGVNLACDRISENQLLRHCDLRIHEGETSEVTLCCPPPQCWGRPHNGCPRRSTYCAHEPDATPRVSNLADAPASPSCRVSQAAGAVRSPASCHLSDRAPGRPGWRRQ
jgi:hypothetical protein